MAWTIIEHKSAPASNQFDFSSLTLSGYQRLCLMLDGLVVGTDNAYIQMRLKISGSEISTGYRWTNQKFSSSGSTPANEASQTGTFIPLMYGTSASYGIGNAAGKSGSGIIYIGNPTNASSLYKLVQIDCAHQVSSSSFIRTVGGAALENSGTMDGLRVYPSTGTLTAGKATLYGLNTA